MFQCVIVEYIQSHIDIIQLNGSIGLVAETIVRLDVETAKNSLELLHKVDTSSVQRSPAGLETALMQPPEPRLLDTIAGLIRARLAARSACDEFTPQAPKGPPNKPIAVDERCPYGVVNGFSTTGARGSPSPETAHLLPESPPDALSQLSLPCPGCNGHKPSIDEGEKRLAVAVSEVGSVGIDTCVPLANAVLSLPCSVHVVPSQITAPRPGFNGHSSSSLIEGEGQLDHSAVNNIYMSSAVHSPESETALAPFIPKPAVMLWASSLSPRLPFEPLDTARPTPCPGHTDVVSIWDNGAGVRAYPRIWKPSLCYPGSRPFGGWAMPLAAEGTSVKDGFVGSHLMRGKGNDVLATSLR